MIWIEGMDKREVILKDASFKEVAEYVEELPQEEQEAAFIAAVFMQEGRR